MAEYTLTKTFQNETMISIESNDLELFIGIEEAINEFIYNFTNENEELDLFENEEEFFCRNEDYKLFKNENRFVKSDGNENENHSTNISENEADKPSKKTNKPPRILTPWGAAHVGSHGYYAITSTLEGNVGKLLHRLIYEEKHKCTLFKRAIIHHKDGNKLNNNPENLELLTLGEHNSKHKTSASLKKRNTISWEEYLEITNQISRDRNSVGYLRVSKLKNPKLKQGFAYQYQWRENGKRHNISAVKLEDLEQKVKAKGLPWQKL